MANPLSLLPLALAAYGGHVDDFEAQQLVAAGLTLLQRSATLVRALSGRRAAILLPTSPSFLVALAACEGRGAVLINPLASRHEIAHQLSDANVGAVFTNRALAAHLPEDAVVVLLDDSPRAAHVVANGSSREVDLGSHFAMRIEGDTEEAGSTEEAVVVYTSAMAGRPLGAVLSHRNVLTDIRATIGVLMMNDSTRMLSILPYSHLFGLAVTLSAPLMAGGRVTTMERFDPARAAELIAEGKITHVAGVPAVFHALIAAIERRGGGVGELQACICGGAPLSNELQDRWAEVTRIELRQGYGLTEAGPVCLFNRVDRDNVRGTLGTPLPGVEVSIREPVEYLEDGSPTDSPTRGVVPQGAIGEICVRGKNVFGGYVSGGERGLQIRDGWLHTGDSGKLNDDGTVSFAGVLKPMFTRNGFNIYPREIEAVVSDMPGVESAQVSGIPVPARENDIALVVRGSVTSADVRRWCSERLASYKQPTTIDVVQAPRT